MLDEHGNLDKRRCWRRLKKLPPGQKLANTTVMIRIARLSNGETKKYRQGAWRVGEETPEEGRWLLPTVS
jgi:hypothetical protein